MLVVFLHPAADDDLRVGAADKPALAQALVAQPPIEALDVSVLRRFAVFDQPQGNATPVRPGQHGCNDPLKTCSGDTLKGVGHERCDGRRDQAVDGQAQGRAGAGDHPGVEDGGGGVSAVRPAAV